MFNPRSGGALQQAVGLTPRVMTFCPREMVKIRLDELGGIALY